MRSLLVDILSHTYCIELKEWVEFVDSIYSDQMQINFIGLYNVASNLWRRHIQKKNLHNKVFIHRRIVCLS